MLAEQVIAAVLSTCPNRLLFTTLTLNFDATMQFVSYMFLYIATSQLVVSC